jgi:hypothetical protein
MGVAIPAFVFMGPSGPAITGAHHWYPLVSADPFGGVGLSAGPDVPHLPELPMTYYTPMITAGTTVATSVTALPGTPRWHSLYGPNLTGN